MARRQLLGLAVVVAVVVVIGAVVAVVLAAGGGDDPVEGSSASPSPTFVASEECRQAGAVVLGDAEAAGEAAPPEHEEAERSAAVARAGLAAVEQECVGAQLALLSDAVAAAENYADQAAACQAASSFLDLDGDGVGMDCPADSERVVSALLDLRTAVADARTGLDRKS